MSGVIELGSSDDERPEPKPKKITPTPNAMVHIPGKFPEVTITPAVASNSKIVHSKNIFYNTADAKNFQQIRNIQINKNPPDAANKIRFLSSKLQCVQPNKLISKPKPNKLKNVITNTAKKFLTNPIKIHSTITNLPSSITVKRTQGQIVKKPVKRKYTQPKVVQTFNLDEDEPASPPIGPQWYMRPEDQIPENITDNKDNQGYNPPNFIEITIEDSPVKPSSKITKSSDLAVTIEDSPAKSVIRKTPSKSTNETTPKKKKSQKVLVYPKEVLEIEIEPKTGDSDSTDKQNNEAKEPIYEVDESPLKVLEKVTQSPENSIQIKLPTPIKDNNDIICIEDETDTNEFHPVYQSLIDLCFKLEDSDDMKKIVEKKIKSYYRQVPKQYTESEEFIDMVSSKILAMTSGPDKMYLYIKDIVDELNLQRKMAQNKVKEEEDHKKKESQTFLYGEDSQFDAKRQRQIRKLEKTIKKLHRAIQKLEEQEVDFDDEDDSVYLLTERYKERMIKVHAKFCQLTNTKMPSEPRIHIDTSPGKPTGAAKRLEKWVNRKVPIGAPLPFPDFHDVLRCVREANAEDKLGLNEIDVMEEARSLFVRCGRKLQRRRQENEWRLAASRITADVDPAEKDENLKKELDANSKTAANKETEVFNKFADRQNQLKLEAEEIEDKEAEESPVDSEEEDVEDNVSLDNKEKRKDILKRLLQEKSTNNKENNKAVVCADVEMKDLQGNENQGESTEIENRTEEDDVKSSETNNAKSSNNMDIDSDIDELHLLQKLHSEEEGYTSHSEFSDSATTISISDSLSDTAIKNYKSDDVISIENSSFSETELNDKNDNPDKHDIVCSSNEETNKDAANIFRSGQLNMDVESEVAESIIHTYHTITPEESDNRCKLVTEGISLASSDDENSQSSTAMENCINLNDDVLSIGETTLSILDNDKAACIDNELLNILENDESGESIFNKTDKYNQLNKDVLVDTEDNVCGGDQPILESRVHVDELIEQVDTIVGSKDFGENSETSQKNGLNKDINKVPKDTNNLLSEGILLASSEDELSKEGVIARNCDTVNDRTTPVMDENNEDNDGTKSNTEISPTKQNPDNFLEGITTEAVVKDASKKNTDNVFESIQTDIHKPSKGDSSKLKKVCELQLDVEMTESNKNINIDTESTSELNSAMESRQTDS